MTNNTTLSFRQTLIVFILIFVITIITVNNTFLQLTYIIISLIVIVILLFWKYDIFIYSIPLLLSVEYRVDLGLFSFTIGEISIILVWISVLHRILSDRKLYVEKIEVVLLFLIIITALPSVALERDTRHALSVYRDLIMPLIFLTGYTLIRLDRHKVINLVKIFVIVAFSTAVLGIIQYRTGDYQWTLSDSSVGWQEYKANFIRTSTIGQILGIGSTIPSGLYANANNFASYLVIPTIVSFSLMKISSQSRRERLFWGVCFIVLLVSLFLTFSRGSIFTFLIVLPLLILSYRHLSIPAVFAILFIGIFTIGLLLATNLFSWDQLGTLRGRVIMFQTGQELLRNHPDALFLGGYSEEYLLRYNQSQLIHNLPFYMILQFGIVATLSWLLLMISKLYKIFQASRSEDEETRILSLSLFGGLFSTIFVYGQTTSFVDSVQSSLWMLFWMGTGTYLYRFHMSNIVSKEDNLCN